MFVFLLLLYPAPIVEQEPLPIGAIVESPAESQLLDCSCSLPRRFEAGNLPARMLYSAMAGHGWRWR